MSRIQIFVNEVAQLETVDPRQGLVAFMVAAQETMKSEKDNASVEMRVEQEDGTTHFTRLLREQGVFKGDRQAAVPSEIAAAIIGAEKALGENLTWITDKLDQDVRQGVPETLEKLKQLEAGWQQLVKALASIGYVGAVNADRG